MITLKPETEALLRQRAERDGTDINVFADALVASALEWEAREEAEAEESLRRSLADSDAGRVRLFSKVAAEWRTKYNLPTHLSEKELFEDIALTRAIQEGEGSGKVSREEVFAILQGQCRRKVEQQDIIRFDNTAA